MLLLVAPARRREPLHHGVGVRGVAQRLRRQALERANEVGVHPRHPAQERAKAKPAQAGDRPRVEAIGVSHALEPVDAIAPPPPDEPEPADGLLVAAQQVREDVLDGPAVLGAGPQDLALGQPLDERQRRSASRRHAPDGLALPGRQDRKSTRLNSSHVAISYAVFCLKKKEILCCCVTTYKKKTHKNMR